MKRPGPNPRREDRQRRASSKVGGKKLSTPLRGELIGGQFPAERGRIGEPGPSRLAAVPGLRRGDCLARPGRKRLLKQREVDQPFAGIVDDVEVEAAGSDQAPQRTGRRVFDADAQLADPPRAHGPLRWVFCKLAQMLLVGKARNLVVGLRLQVGAPDAPVGHCREEGQAPAGNEVAHQGGDEDGLARARKARDAKSEARGHQVGDESHRRCRTASAVVSLRSESRVPSSLSRLLYKDGATMTTSVRDPTPWQRSSARHRYRGC